MYRDIEKEIPEFKVVEGKDPIDFEYQVTMDGEVLFIWDGADANPIEDLCFLRGIGEVFLDGVEAGLKLAEKRNAEALKCS